MSIDLEIHGVPERVTAADIAASLVLWCGPEIASLESAPVLHVALRGLSRVDAEWLRAPRAVEIHRPSPRVAWLTLRLADAFTTAVAEGFAVWWAQQHGERVVWSTSGRVVWTRGAP